MFFKLSNPNSNLARTLGYLDPALNNSAQAKRQLTFSYVSQIFFFSSGTGSPNLE